ncbi:MAG: hypothetical protein RLZZ612_108 [Pseudomonadota bacterium]|jgi:AAA15 family ATPase/GTPase
MLKRFEVENFRNFQENFVFDLSETKNYEFNPECVDNGIVSKGLIYGINGCGKSNLGWALLDISSHLTDIKIPEHYKTNYLNGNSIKDVAAFKYVFEFSEGEVEYVYQKTDIETITSEKLIIDGQQVISYTRGRPFTTDLNGAENLNKDLSDSEVKSAVRYVIKNTALEKSTTSELLRKFFKFVSDMRISTESVKEPERFTKFIVQGNHLQGFGEFLNGFGIRCTLEADDEKKGINFIFKNKKIDFWKTASTGTQTLARLYLYRQSIIENRASLLYLDEFDAFYHFELSSLIISELKKQKSQIILTTHNTSLMSNDLLRPDCNFVMQNDTTKPLYQLTDKELRFAHNIEKMYRGGVFDV